MSFMDWVGTVGAVWLAVSIVAAVAWAVAGRRVFRKPPVHPVSESTAKALADFVQYDAEMRGRQ